jgi:hypothetical protein
MLSTIENMKFFLRKGFGDSTSFAGGGISIKTQGLTQGNNASPTGWGVSVFALWACMGRKDMAPNSTAQLQNWSTTYPQSSTWTTLTSCTLI